MCLHGTIKLTVQCIKCQTKVFRCYHIIKGILVGPEMIKSVLQNVARSGERLRADPVPECRERRVREGWLPWGQWCSPDVKTRAWNIHSFFIHLFPAQTQEQMWIVKIYSQVHDSCLLPLASSCQGRVIYLSLSSKTSQKDYRQYLWDNIFFLFFFKILSEIQGYTQREDKVSQFFTLFSFSYLWIDLFQRYTQPS